MLTKISTAKPKWNNPLGRAIFTWQYNIKMDHQVFFEDIDWIYLPYRWHQYQATVTW
jgi:hypothetical protein